MTSLLKIYNDLTTTERRIGLFMMLFLAITLTVAAKAYAYIPDPEVRIVRKVEKVPVYLSAKDRKQIACMAENTYFEAAYESRDGKIAVNNVVMNRVADARFPKTPCAVISQRTNRVCQFSWKCERGKRVRDHAAYAEAKKIAEQVYIGNIGDVTGGAKFYHADYVNPRWRMQRLIQIDSHIFYQG